MPRCAVSYRAHQHMRRDLSCHGGLVIQRVSAHEACSVMSWCALLYRACQHMRSDLACTGVPCHTELISVWGVICHVVVCRDIQRVSAYEDSLRSDLSCSGVPCQQSLSASKEWSVMGWCAVSNRECQRMRSDLSCNGVPCPAEFISGVIYHVVVSCVIQRVSAYEEWYVMLWCALLYRACQCMRSDQSCNGVPCYTECVSVWGVICNVVVCCVMQSVSLYEEWSVILWCALLYRVCQHMKTSISIHGTNVDVAHDYDKKKNVFRLTTLQESRLRSNMWWPVGSRPYKNMPLARMRSRCWLFNS